MRSPQAPAASIVELIEPFRKLLTEGRWKYLLATLTTLATSERAGIITEIWRRAEFDADYEQFRRLFFNGPFEDESWMSAQIEMIDERTDVTTTLPSGESVVVAAVDDTINKCPFASKIFGIATHFDHAPRPHQRSYVQGHRELLCGLIPDALGPTGARAFITDACTWVPVDHDDPSGHEPLTHDTRARLAGWQLERLRPRLPAHQRLLVLVDAFFGKNPLIGEIRRLPNTDLLARMQSNRVLYDLPGPPSGRPGGPRKYGARINWRARLADEGDDVEVELYGRPRQVRVWSKIVKLNRLADPVRVIAAQLLDKPNSKPVLFVTTDLSLDPVVALRLYAARFRLEEVIKDLRQNVGWGRDQLRLPKGRDRMRRWMLIAHTVMRLLAEIQPDHIRRRLRDPWRSLDTPVTVGEIRQALQHEAWRGGQILSTFARRPKPRSIRPHRSRRSSQHPTTTSRTRSRRSLARRPAPGSS